MRRQLSGIVTLIVVSSCGVEGGILQHGAGGALEQLNSVCEKRFGDERDGLTRHGCIFVLLYENQIQVSSYTRFLRGFGLIAISKKGFKGTQIPGAPVSSECHMHHQANINIKSFETNKVIIHNA